MRQRRIRKPADRAVRVTAGQTAITSTSPWRSRKSSGLRVQIGRSRAQAVAVPERSTARLTRIAGEEVPGSATLVAPRRPY